MGGEGRDCAFEFPGIGSIRYRAYPIVDHVADKVCALLELHPRAAGSAQASTRYRDLADLALIAHTLSVAADELRRAIDSEVRRRGIELPEVLAAPQASGWRTGYARVARDVPGLPERDLDAALATVRGFIDPVLAGTASGRWTPYSLAWSL